MPRRLPSNQHATPAATAAPSPKTISIDVLDNGHVAFTLQDGSKYEIREPNARALLMLEGWVATHPEYGTDSIIALKLVYDSIVEEKPPTFDEFFDSLSIRDVEVVASALSTFRSVFDYLAERAGVRQQ